MPKQRTYKRDSKGRFAATAGAPLGGKRKILKPDPWRRSLNVAKAADTKAGGGVKGTVAGVRAARQLQGMASISQAAMRAGMGNRSAPRGGQSKKNGRKPKVENLNASQRAERTATWVRKPGEGWVRNRPSKAKSQPKTAWERAERTATWVRKPGEGWVRNRR